MRFEQLWMKIFRRIHWIEDENTSEPRSETSEQAYFMLQTILQIVLWIAWTKGPRDSLYEILEVEDE